MFQFPNGSIKSTLLMPDAKTLVCFNSLMVRLKVLVRMVVRTGATCFNSLMVRLKEMQRAKGNRKGVLFQFPNGSIKRLNGELKALKVPTFQFPNGSIKSKLHKPFQHICQSVSIP